MRARELEPLREQPIPRMDRIAERLPAYTSVPFSSDERSEEPLVDLREVGIAGRNHYFCADAPPYFHRIPGSISELMARAGVAARLQRVNDRLRTGGLELFVLDAYRPIAVQNYFFFHWVPRFLRQLHPSKTEEWVGTETRRYWAPGVRSEGELRRQVPPHSTGGAVDLTIRFVETGHLLEMGSIFDDVSERSHVDHFEGRDLDGFTALEAARNRRLLYHLMTEHGFVVHPREWWHFSHGDQMWALGCGRSHAPYGYTCVPGRPDDF